MTPTEVFISVAIIITLVYGIAVYVVVRKKKDNKNSHIDVMPVTEKKKIVAKKRLCDSCDNVIIPEFDGKVYTCPICNAIVNE